jgi:hypothetical protein
VEQAVQAIAGGEGGDQLVLDGLPIDSGQCGSSAAIP